MNILNRVTTKTLMKNKTRTVVTIIGIILSAAMLTAVTTFISSLKDYMYQVAVYNRGEWYCACHTVTDETADELANDDRIKSSVTVQNIGYSAVDGMKNDMKPYLFVAGAGDDYFDSMPVHITEGRLPGSNDEIILPEHLSDVGGVNYSIGDKISLDIGDRVSNGSTLDQYAGYQDGSEGATEELVDTVQRQYTVVGIYERSDNEPYSAPGYTAFTRRDDSFTDSSEDIYLLLKNPSDTYDYIDELMRREDVGSCEDNSDVLTYIGVSSYSGFYSVLYGLAAILIALIMFGSISLIYNAFSISVSERTRQFGLLKSIGATKKQLMRSVLFEALFVSAIGIPAGILCGILGIGVTLKFVGSLLTGMYNGSSPGDLSLHVSLIAIVAAAAIGLLTVIISAWIPASRAKRITAIEAIRQTKDISTKNKRIKTSRLTYRLFGLEGMLASKQFKRNRKKYRATVISLFMSIVLFISASSFCSYLTTSVSKTFSVNNYDIQNIYADTFDYARVKDLHKMLVAAGSTNEDTLIRLGSGFVSIDSDIFSDDMRKYSHNASNALVVCSIDDATFERYINELGLDESLYTNPEKPLAIAQKTASYFDFNIEKYLNYDRYTKNEFSLDVYMYDSVAYDALCKSPDYEPSEEYIPPENNPLYTQVGIDVGYLTDTLPLGADAFSEGNPIVIYSESVASALFGDNLISSAMASFFRTDDHAACHEKMTELLQNENESTAYLVDAVKTSEINRNTTFIINVFSYGFIILISLITVANVFNTISTNINLRRREFATLKSVGMTRRGFNRMMNFECLLYGAKALLLGLPVSVGVTYLIYNTICSGFMINFYIPWESVLIAVFSVFAVVFVAMLYSMSKIKKDNPIDALRNENL